MDDREKRQLIMEVRRAGESHPSWCQSPHIIDGKDYRLEPKPRGTQSRLESKGFVCETVDGLLHVRVPLGTHGADHLVVDEDGSMRCRLCEGGE